ncbi:hypothetical protein A2483_00025 [Candidatus Peregrinibacteria bacterium RIFOXYC2_FULL_33_13]|nr:MAG: Major facilitator family transporter [Candidatus Peregrinibacteria bacterium GW2011_GWA2_33_10]KKP40883.1 MAG: major facilitator family transporter [Candidatus Peregrinibacteria bacterium GW2011_GWC2_33_13]OGJ50770.1 MAG: hypothetical protein A2229_05450 [Candidatus Peregrinibacteria bacterium RIFOXYA2_FULL_33_7]OGJ53179.1 MAG: hypothetical protein A2483_00025 [Candidatus Peregrinibacteria bacterium RIFOXYC2_FULL_33_13]
MFSQKKSHTYTSFIRNYILCIAFYDFIFAYAIYTVYFSIQGLSPFQISLLLTFWALSSAVFEIPSGAFADYWSRRKMMIIAPILKSLCFISWYFANGNFYIFVLGFLFWTIGSTFLSGTAEALLYDNLTAFNQKENYAKILGKSEFYRHIAQMISIFSGGFIAYFNIKFAIIFSIFPLLFASIFAYLLHDAPKIESTGEIKYLDYFKIAFQEIKNSKILIVLFISYVIFGIFGNFDEFDQLYYKLVNLPIWAFGIMGTIWSGISAIGVYFAHKFEKNNYIYYTVPILSGILLFFAGYFPGIIMISAIMMAYLLNSPIKILLESKIQHTISSHSRATITSISSFLLNIFGALSFPIFGLIATNYRVSTIYWINGIVLILFSFWVYKLITALKKSN